MNLEIFKEKYNPEKLLKLSDEYKIKLFKRGDEFCFLSILEQEYNYIEGIPPPGNSSFDKIEWNSINGWTTGGGNRSKNVYNDTKALDKINSIIMEIWKINSAILGNSNIKTNIIGNFPKVYFIMLYPEKFIGILDDKIFSYVCKRNDIEYSDKEHEWYNISRKLATIYQYSIDNWKEKNVKLWNEFNISRIENLNPNSEFETSSVPTKLVKHDKFGIGKVIEINEIEKTIKIQFGDFEKIILEKNIIYIQEISLEDAAKKDSERNKIYDKKNDMYETIKRKKPNKRSEYINKYIKKLANKMCSFCKRSTFDVNSEMFDYKIHIPELQVHHVKPLSESQANDTIENCIALCPDCHRREHLKLKVNDKDENEQQPNELL